MPGLTVNKDDRPPESKSVSTGKAIFTPEEVAQARELVGRMVADRLKGVHERVVAVAVRDAVIEAMSAMTTANLKPGGGIGGGEATEDPGSEGGG